MKPHLDDTRRGPRAFTKVSIGCLASGLVLSALFAGCGAKNETGGWGGSGAYGGYGGSGAYGGYGGYTSTSTGTGTTTTPPPPPEKEVESSFGAPVATGNYVWIANPASGRVAYIDANTLEIKLVDAGHGPTYLAAVPGAESDVALVLNVLSKDATILRAEKGMLTATSVPVPASGNAWSVSPDGRWAVAWTNARDVKNADPVEGYQDVAVIDLAKGKEASFDLTVGYRPVGVTFDKSGAHAFAVTQDGVTVVALDAAGPAVVKNVGLGDTATSPSTARDVSITPDGAYALVRREGEEAVSVVSLGDGAITAIPLPGPVTDLDLTADGATAVAVVRSTNQVALLPVPGILAKPDAPILVTADVTIGSAALAAASPVAFLYTNATPSPILAVMDMSAAAPSPRDILLRAPILGVFPTADAAHAVVLHDQLTEAGSHYPSAVSLAPIALALPPKIVGLDALPISIAVAPAGDHALVAAGDEAKAIYQLLVASMPSLAVQKLTLASMPIAAGIVPAANRGFVAQKHPDGRITFVGLSDGQARTITGFELATQVVDGTP